MQINLMCDFAQAETFITQPENSISQFAFMDVSGCGNDISRLKDDEPPLLTRKRNDAPQVHKIVLERKSTED